MTDIASMEALLANSLSLHERIAADVPQLRRGMVWCRICGRSERVDSANALRHGWPKCHGQTMTIDSPEERPKLAMERQPSGLPWEGKR
jgi:hypothetical protein